MILAILVAALLARAPVMRTIGEPLSGDEVAYDSLARQVLAGKGFSLADGTPTAWRAPGFPMVLALAYAVVGQHPGFARVVLAVVTSTAAPALYVLALLLLAARGESPAAFDVRCVPTGCVAPPSNIPDILSRRALPVGRLARLGATLDFHHGLLGRRAIAVVAGFAWVGLSNSRHLADFLYGEGIAALLVIVAFGVVVVARTRRSTTLAVLGGLLLGGAVLTRPYLLLTVIGPAAWLWVSGLRRQALAVATVTALLVGAWAVRNQARVGSFTVTTQAAEEFWRGNNQWARGSWPGDLDVQHTYLLARHPEFDSLDEISRARIYFAEARAEAVARPGRLMWLLPRKAFLYFTPNFTLIGVDWVYAVLAPFALAGMFVTWRTREQRVLLWLLGFPVLAVLAVVLVTFGHPRFRHPVDPLIVLLGSVGLERSVACFRQRGQPLAPAWVAAPDDDVPRGRS